MKAGLLFRTLFRYSWIASIIITIYTFIFLYIVKVKNTPPLALAYAIFAGARFFVQGLITIFILVGIYKLMPTGTCSLLSSFPALSRWN